jgi:periplasmic protein TonB
MGMLSHTMVRHPSIPARGSFEPWGVGRMAAGWHAVRARRAPAMSKGTIALSVVVHAAAVIVLTLLVQSRTNDTATDPASFELVFVPTQAVAPASVAPAPDNTAAAATEETVPAPAPEPLVAAEPAPAELPLPPVPPDVSEPVDHHESVANDAVVARPTPEAAAPKRVIVARPHAPVVSQPVTAAQPAGAAAAEAQSSITGAISFGAAAQVVPPRPVAGMETNRAPIYPDLARRRGEQGRVLLRVNVSADGTPLDVAVLDTSGHQSLDAAALSAIRQWRFVPATQAGRAVPAEADVPVRFRLDN